MWRSPAYSPCREVTRTRFCFFTTRNSMRCRWRAFSGGCNCHRARCGARNASVQIAPVQCFSPSALSHSMADRCQGRRKQIESGGPISGAKRRKKFFWGPPTFLLRLRDAVHGYRQVYTVLYHSTSFMQLSSVRLYAGASAQGGRGTCPLIFPTRG